jgi:anti-sigma B factor antagonist
MTVEVRTENDVAVVGLVGAIDSKTAPTFEAELRAVVDGHSRILLNMARVDFLSSAGLRLLVLLYRQAKARDGKIALAHVSEEIQDVMTNTGFRQFFIVADTEAEALAALASPLA